MTTATPKTKTNIADIQAKLSEISNRSDAINFRFNLMLNVLGITEGDLPDLPDNGRPSMFTDELMTTLNDMTFSASEEAKESPTKRTKY
jgi:hypothetical protein